MHELVWSSYNFQLVILKILSVFVSPDRDSPQGISVWCLLYVLLDKVPSNPISFTAAEDMTRHAYPSALTGYVGKGGPHPAVSGLQARGIYGVVRGNRSVEAVSRSQA